MKRIKHHIRQIIQALIDAGFNPQVIKEFLETQLEIDKKINDYFNKDRPYKEDYIQNQIKITQIYMFKDMLDRGFEVDWQTVSEVSAKIGKHSADKIKTSLINAGIDISIIKEFLKEQIEVLRDVSARSKNSLSREDIKRNEIMICQVTILKNLL